MPLTTNYNVSPYWDDFTESKRFHRMLFRPARAVQARELTQMQSILQNQIERFGDHIFKEGSIVVGCNFQLDLNYNYVKLRDRDANNALITVADFANTTITGQTSGIKAKVLAANTGSEAAAPDYNTVFVKYIQTGTNNIGYNEFSNNEVIVQQVDDGGSGAAGNTITTSTTGKGSAFSVGVGILYAKGHFVQVSAQTLVLEKYNNTPSYRIGFEVTESSITSDNDSSLLDNASGSTNFAAPGADRIKLTAALVKKSLTANTSNFFEIFKVTNGEVESSYDKPQYAVIGDEVARRTFEESGNYTVVPYKVRIREHLLAGSNLGKYTAAQGGDSDKLTAGIEPGLSYIRGYRQETYMTEYLNIDKATDVKLVESQTIPAAYGNYVLVDEICGPWDINNMGVVSLRDGAANAITNNTLSSTAAPGSEIGTARTRAIVHSSGDPGDLDTQYRVYLFDINFTTAGKSFSDVRCLYMADTTNSFGDCVLESSNAVLKETAFTTLVFPFAQSAIKRLRDSSGSNENLLRFNKYFDVTLSTAGTVAVATGVASEQYPYSTGALNATQVDTDTLLVTRESGSTANLTGTIKVSTTANTANGSGTAFTTELNVGDFIRFNNAVLQGGSRAGEIKRVTGITDATHIVLDSAAAVANATSAFAREYPLGTFFDMNGNGGDAATRSVTIDSTTQATFDLQETLGATINARAMVKLKRVNAQESAKTINKLRYVKIDLNTHTEGTTGPWGLGLADVHKITNVYVGTTYDVTNTDQVAEFSLDDGMRDGYYDHAQIRLKSSSSLALTASQKLLVKLDYFTHDTSSGVGFNAVDSYPVNDASPSNTSIRTYEIPVYRSPTTGKEVDLRDAVDFRDRKTDTANNSTTLGAASENPANSTVGVANTTNFDIPSGGVHIPTPNGDFESDLEYYLRRKDKIIQGAEGEFFVLKGVPALVPRTPSDQENSMTIAVLDIPPFPSLAPNIARTEDRPEYGVTFKPFDNRRYTMRDIGTLEQRINTMEYYTSLSLLEKDASEFKVLDSSGIDRFKNGILVDPFTGHNVGNIFDTDYAAAIDPNAGEMRAKFNIENVELFQSTANASSNIYRSANDIILTVGSVNGTFTAGEDAYQGATLAAATAQGKVLYWVSNTKIYIERSQGTWATSTDVIGNSSTANGSVSATAYPGLQQTTSKFGGTGGDLITLPYSHSKLINQRFASKARNCVGELQFIWVGKIALTPDNDHWTDTTQRPDVQINFDGNADAWENLSDAWGTQWNDWQTVWSGTNVSEREVDERLVINESTAAISTTRLTTTSTTQRQTRNGISLQVVPKTVQQHIGAKTVDVSIIPFMRSRIIRVHGHGMRPNTRVYSIFDGENVSSYVTPTNSSYANTANEGGAMVTDSTGNVYGTFRIPNDSTLQFRVGTKTFRFADASNNAIDIVSTSAEGKYTAFGVLNTTQDTIISTREADIQSTVVRDTRTLTDTNTTAREGGMRRIALPTAGVAPAPVAPAAEAPTVAPTTRAVSTVAQVVPATPVDLPVEFGGQPPIPWELADDFGGGGADPIAQTFLVKDAGGVFITQIAVYFKTKSSTFPITLQLREVINGFPGPKIVPFGEKTLTPSEVNISSTAEHPTLFQFNSPVYAKSNQEYCFVLKPAGNNPDYEIWISELGGTDVLTSEIISNQPAAGVLFTSANDRSWTEHQPEDLKFIVYRANFDRSKTGNIFLDNDDEDYFTVANIGGSVDVGEIVHGETVIGFTSNTAAVDVGATITGNTSGANGTVTLKPTANTARIRNVSATKFTIGEVFDLSTGGLATLTAQSTANGIVKLYDSSTKKLQLDSSSGTFAANTTSADGYVKGQKGLNEMQVTSINDHALHSMFSTISEMKLHGTDIVWTVRPTSNADSVATAHESFTPGENYHFTGEKKIASKTNEVDNLSGTKSFLVKGALTTIFNSVSPVVDLGRVGTTAIGNIINNTTAGETAAGGSATARYITRQVTLNDGQDAEDLKLIITAYRPAGTDITAYGRFHNSEDEELFTDKAWTALDYATGNTTYSDLENRNDFLEYEFSVPTTNATTTGAYLDSSNTSILTYSTTGGAQFATYKTFAIKLVLTTGNKTVIPRVKDIRALALQV